MTKKTTHQRHSRHTAARKSNLNPWLWIGLLVALAVAAFIFLNPSQPARAATITPQDAYQKYNQGVFLLDVRTQQEWDEFHVPNTTLIPLDELPQRLDEVPAGQEIIVICRSGNRSQQERDILLDAGFDNMSSMSGGLKEWQALGYPLE
jgi:rhodanese-related sulfurtransferase